ncbi:MAG: acyl carrier protein [Acidobacteria bacterium]|nr:acyl carrier protein [Acidobacteriota bacterium]
MTTDIAAIEKIVRDHLAARLSPGAPPESLGRDRALISGGLLDSISTVALITFLEQQFGVSFEAHEISIDYLDTVGDIAATVARKLGGR